MPAGNTEGKKDECIERDRIQHNAWIIDQEMRFWDTNWVTWGKKLILIAVEY